MSIRYLSGINVDSNTLFVDDANNRVGIGTDSPSHSLHISGLSTSAIAFGGTSLKMGSYTGIGTTRIFSDGSYLIYSTADSYHDFTNSGSSLMRITNTGNVGIGTTSPAYGLTVQNNNTINTGFRNTAGDALAIKIGTGLITFLSTYEVTGTNMDIAFTPTKSNGTQTEALRIQASSGNVGIGTTSPNTKLHVEDGTAFITVRGNDASYSNAAIQLISGNATNNRALGVFHYVENSDVEWFAGLPYAGNDAYVINRNTGYTVPSSQSSPPGIGASGTRLFTINSSGNVGIGTTSPATLLHVSNAGSVTARFSNTATSVNTEIGVASGLGYVGTQSANAFGIVTSDTERIRITSTGNVGIGTTSPSQKLEVAGNVLVTTSGSTQPLKTFDSTDVTYKQFSVDYPSSPSIYTTQINFGNFGRLQYDGNSGALSLENTSSFAGLTRMLFVLGTTERMRITDTGNVGIGTTSPSYKLDVYGAVGGNATLNLAKHDGDQYLRLIGGNGGTQLIQTAYDLGIDVGFAANRVLTIKTGTSYVGIGTTSPAYKLDVVGESRIQGQLRVTGNNVVSGYTDITGVIYHRDSLSALNKAQNGWIGWAIRDTSGSETVMNLQNIGSFTANGNVGIGTASPGYKLHVVGDTRIEGNLTINGTVTQIDTDTLTTEQWLVTNDGTGPAVVINQKGTQPVIDIQDDGVSSFYIADGGNVGIGTTTPGKTLDITGEIRTSGRATFNEYVNTSLVYGNTDLNLGYAGGTTGILINSSGNVGIGTAIPSSLLHVKNTTYGTALAQFETSGRPLTIGAQSAYVYMGYGNREQFKIAASSGTGRFILGSNLSDDTINTLQVSGSSYFAGNVGIGTTSPGAKLEVVGAGNIIKATSSGSDSSYFQAVNGSYSYVAGVATALGTGYMGMTSNHPLAIVTNGSERMRILSNGDVAIGATYSIDHLYVSKTAGSSIGIGTGGAAGTVASPLYTSLNFRGYGDYIKGQIQSYDVSSNAVGGLLTFSVQDTGATLTERMRITSAGNVGIGTDSPVATLEVKGGTSGFRSITSDATSVTFSMLTDLGYGYDNAAQLIAGKTSTDNAHLIFATKTAGSITEKVRITSAGTVGIGTTSPSSSYKLDVYGAVRVKSAGGVYIDATDYGDNSGGSIDILNRGTTRALRIVGTTGTGWGDVLINPYNGRVGIGTTDPTQALHVSGSARVTGAYYDSNNSAGTSGQVLSSTGSGTDWVSLSEITGVDGTGTANYVSKWSDADTITDSTITDDGTTVTAGVERFNILYQAGIYSFSDTVNASTSEDIFSISNTHGAQAFRVTFVCNIGSFSVAKTYEVVHSYGNTPVAFKVVDSGPYSGNDFDVAFTNAVTDTGIKCAITNNSTTANANIVTTIFLGGSPTTITVTEH